jgi:hypothetical protein
MNDLSNALLLALIRMGLLIQMGFYRSASTIIRFISAHRSLVLATWLIVRLGPAIVLSVLLYFIILELAEWWFGG